MTVLIQIENLHYRPDSLHPDQPDILCGIDLTIEKGSFVAIIGKNGSGKTTLIKHINGLLIPTRGRIFVDGLDTSNNEHRRRLRGMVGMVFQNPADQIVASTVAEDVAFGLENLNLPTSIIRARVVEQLTNTGLLGEADRPPHLLSGGQIQKVALAGVMVRRPQVILFDEPTSMLDGQARESLLNQILQLKEQGMTILYITHHMEEAVHADQIVVMNDGKITSTGSPEEVFWEHDKLYEIGLEAPEVVRFAKSFQSLGWPVEFPVLTQHDLMTLLPDYPGKGDVKYPTGESANQYPHPPLIELKNVHYTYLSGSPLAQQALTGVDLSLQQGLIHAIAGVNGSGKSTLLQHLNAILRPSQGSVRVGSFMLEEPLTALIDVIREVGLVFQNPESQFFEVFVGDEIAYGPKQFEMENIRERVRRAMEMVGLDFDTLKDRRLETLSGGEKRKIALASTLVLDQEIMMFDEPTAGMDPNARQELLTLFSSLREQGKTIIIASHRMEEIAKTADTLSLMKNGKITETGLCGQVLASISAIKNAGLVPPLAVQITRSLLDKEWPINPSVTGDPDNLISALEALIQ